MRKGSFVFFLLFSLVWIFNVQAQTKTRFLLIYDASNSMNGRWQSDSKMNISKKLLVQILDSLSKQPDVELALRVYGHQSKFPPLDCNDTKLEVPFSPNNVKQIENKIKSLVPRGSTPIAYSLEQAANDFPPCANCRNIIILITDGLEECGGDPCAASAYLQSKGISLRPFVIGIGEDFKNAFDCVGEYLDASSETEFVRAFDIVISQALNATSVQVNLLDEKGLPTESNVNMSFYDHISKKWQVNFIHTLNARAFPDTISLDPLLTYDLIVHTIPSLKKDSIELRAGIHNVIALDAAQGQLMVRATNTRIQMAKPTACIVRKKGSLETLHVLSINEQEKFLTGSYDLEILSLPRLYIKDVSITSNTLTTVDIPAPGVLILQRVMDGVTAVYADKAGVLELVYNMNSNAKSESIYLLPGKYMVVSRSKYQQRSSATKQKAVTIEAGMSTTISF